MAKDCWVKAIIVAAASTAVSAQYHCTSAVSRRSAESSGNVDMEIFGTLPNSSIWADVYKFSQNKWSGLFNVSAFTRECPSVVPHGTSGTVLFYTNLTGGNVMYQDISGGDSSDDTLKKLKDYNLGGNVSTISALKSESPYEQDAAVLIAGLALNGSYVAKRVTVGDPEDASLWCDLGGNFTSKPAMATRGQSDDTWVFGIDSNGTLQYNSFMGAAFGGTEWVKLEGGPFQGNPIVTIQNGMFNVWAIDSNRSPNHRILTIPDDEPTNKKWENLGGSFSDTPAVSPNHEGPVSLVGKGQTGEKYYTLTYFPGSDSKERKWVELGGPFLSQPVVLSDEYGERLDVFAIDKTDEIQHLEWDSWQKAAPYTETLGKLPPHNQTATSSVLGSLEL